MLALALPATPSFEPWSIIPSIMLPAEGLLFGAVTLAKSGGGGEAAAAPAAAAAAIVAAAAAAAAAGGDGGDERGGGGNGGGGGDGAGGEGGGGGDGGIGGRCSTVAVVRGLQTKSRSVGIHVAGVLSSGVSATHSAY